MIIGTVYITMDYDRECQTREIVDEFPPNSYIISHDIYIYISIYIMGNNV